jgi:cobalt transporter subunit CbtA
MTVRYLLAALAAGLLAGVLMTPVQMTRIVPIILHAEEFEGGGNHHEMAGMGHKIAENVAPVGETAVVTPAVEAHDHAATEASDEKPLLLGRFWNTIFANLVSGAGFGLLLGGVVLLSGMTINFRNGVIWGVAGWMAFQFLPGLGLPPELPGFPEVDLHARQVWWVATVGMAIAGMLLLFSRMEMLARIAGIALLVAPHIYGAPQPVDISAPVPAYLAAEFVMAALSTTLFFWLVLGLAMGWFMERAEKHG